MNGKRSIRLMAWVLVLGILAAACAPEATQAPATEAVEPEGETEVAPAETEAPAVEETAPEGDIYGGSITVALAQEPVCLDPALSTSLHDRQVMQNLFVPLFRLMPDGSVVPEAVASFEYPVPTTAVFRLHPNIQFHDGTPLNAEVVKWNFDRMLDPETNSPRAREIASLESVEIVDEFTVQLNLSQPDAALHAALTDRAGMMVPPHAIEELGEDFCRQPVGNGPFKFVEWLSNERLVLERNEGFFQEGLPYLDRIVYRFIADGNVRVTAVRTGEVNVIAEVPAKDLEALGQETGLQVIAGRPLSYRSLEMNIDTEVFANVACRQAVAYAIDREEIQRAVYSNTGEPLYGPITSAFGAYYDPDFRMFQNDPEQARAKLEECGKPDGFEFTLTTINSPTDQLLAQVIQQQLEEVGITMNIELFDFNTVVDKLINQEYQSLTMGWSGRPDPDGQFRGFHSEDSFNWFGYNSPEVDALLTRGLGTLDQNQRVEIYRQAQALIAEDVPKVFVHAPQYTDAVVLTDSVHDFETVPDGLMRFEEVWVD